ncbi:MAG TPA: patatin-like phospholipase family protein [Bacteroidia bacterium]|nr:patatin-like phospholipase family protein [Bacteroidia bacterium]HRS58428.1 patatin-like phospholipase family protein [Bacteroidia bacterium]HRU68438.1 patatin-like phospholipase family protein [Bacteroidia bacterium]
MAKQKKHEWGIALSGGAARGFAHLGVLKFIEEQNIFPGIVAGTSAGSIAGAFYADGYSPDETFEIFSHTKIMDFLDISLPKKGLLKKDGLKKILEGHLRAKTFEELKKPLYICVTDLNNARAEYLNQGNLIEAVLASCAIPVIFEPLIRNDVIYVDGGVVNNLPVEPIRPLCNRLIAVNVNPLTFQKEISGVVSILVRSFLMAASKDIASKKSQADIYIETTKISKFAYYEIKKGKEMFEIGYKAAKDVFDTLKTDISD